MEESNRILRAVSVRRNTASAAAKKAVFARAGGRCSFPGCALSVTADEGYRILELAHIEPLSTTRGTSDEQSLADNLIVLCPNHHALVDADPAKYSPDWLKAVKAKHEAQIKAALASDIKPVSVPATVPEQLKSAWSFWTANRGNSNEETWQSFLTAHPHVIAQAIPDYVIQIGQKCFVGGKSITNHGGNIVDFLYAQKISKNVMLVEIKTPSLRILGKQYRQNAYSISEELTGAIVQVLNYRLEIQRNYYNLMGNSPDVVIESFEPQCLVIAGDLEAEQLAAIQLRSLQMFRAVLGPVRVMTFDEVFGKLKDLIDMLGQ
jgi:hypothetical protein